MNTQQVARKVGAFLRVGAQFLYSMVLSSAVIVLSLVSIVLWVYWSFWGKARGSKARKNLDDNNKIIKAIWGSYPKGR